MKKDKEISTELVVKKEQQTKQEIKKPNQNTIDAKFMFLVLVSIISGFFGGYLSTRNNTTFNASRVTREVVDSEGNLINTIAKDVSPSVVSVDVTGKSVSQNPFGYGRETESRSAGTGFIISRDGLILTNRHVVPSGTSEVKVTLSDGSEFTADVVGKTNDSDPLDIAFLKIKDLGDTKLTPANLGDSDKMEVGDKVVAIGNALGEFQNTVTSGIISGFGRDIKASDGQGSESLQNLFQTDAAINSGNSGGPLVNSASEVIGINVATAGVDNISFAIPINDVKTLVDTVIQTGKLERPYLGVRYVTLNEQAAEQLNIDQIEGAYIPRGTSQNPSIIKDSPADKAGLLPGDVITEINGKKLDEKTTLVTVLGSSRVGDSVEIKVVRKGENKTINATLEALPESR